MKLLSQKGDPFTVGTPGPGEVKLVPEDAEDLWHTYNILVAGDTLTATAIRKVQKESSTGSVDSQRVKVKLAVQIQRVDFDPEGGELRLSGRVTNEVEGVRLGSHHTLTVEVHRAFSLHKECWDSVSLERLREATTLDGGRSAELVAVLIKESATGGLAQLFLVSGGMSVAKARLEANPFPKQGDPRVVHGGKKARERWFDQLLAAILRHVELGAVKCVILAGPGFTKDAFFEFMLAEAARRSLRELLVSKPKWVVCHASSAYKHALREVFTDPTVATRISDTRAAAEVLALGQFFDMMRDQPDRVTYGLRHVRYASEQGAVDKLLLADTLFRAQNIARRAEHVALVEATKGAGGGIHIFSDLHASGEQLANLGGVAALLRFPLPIDDLLEDDDDGDDAAEGEEDASEESEPAEAPG